MTLTRISVLTSRSVRSLVRMVCCCTLFGLFLVGCSDPSGGPAATSQGAENGRIAFSDLDDQGKTQVFTMLPDGSDRHQLTTSGENLFPAWSPDGADLAFVSMRTGDAELWTMDADGGNQTKFAVDAPRSAFTPEWSPDGSRLAFSLLDEAVGHPEVWVMDADATNARRLTVTPKIQTAPTWSLLPTWSPDGQRIAYASTASGSSQIWVMDSDASNPIQLTDGNGPNFPDANAPDWSRDGTKIVFWSGFESRFGEIWVMDADGSNARQLTETTDPMNSDNPAWSPNGKSIIFDSNRAGPGKVDIWIMNADGANVRILTTGRGQSSWQLLPASTR